MDEFQDYKNNQIEKPPEHGEQATNDALDLQPDSTRDEEFAAELTAEDYNTIADQDEDTGTETNTMYGWIGVVLSVVSFFMWPVILGAAGIIFGFISRGRNADTLGNIAIGAGAVSILISLFILPFV
ncbi:hypothetical protein GLV94_13180 [Virgibacillus halodenitrificans]|uniref:hypothetical protein n=1 Tax=Virgibacillus halodenitrificans TaxID=1482 RepID=UPI00136E4ECA|nr:hypothetical protein [Virgibacillus halodenitrificans]MYL46596.1 hypothetical protein [Virgibacillus halodenitrificans]